MHLFVFIPKILIIILVIILYNNFIYFTYLFRLAAMTLTTYRDNRPLP